MPPDHRTTTASLGVLAAATVAVALMLLMFSAPARAFDSGPHNDLTRDALASEGIAGDAADAIQVSNWFVDLYENAGTTPHSGHASFWKRLLGGALTSTEDWSDDLVAAADRSHFDSTDGGYPNTLALSNEWERLKRATAAAVRGARDRERPVEALSAIGISMHQVQDFYSHTNWVEPARAGFDGPGWERHDYGRTPTWFDIPPAVRMAQPRLYSGGAHGVARAHGGWRSDGNRHLETSMNKDWSARPYYHEAYMAAYFASRAWIRAVRSWVDDEDFWARLRRYVHRQTGGPKGASALEHDVRHAFRISYESGHWNGQGEPMGSGDSGPSGSLSGLRDAIGEYFDPPYRPYRKTVYRATFERVALRIADARPADPAPPLADVPGTADLQAATRFVRVRVDEMRGRGAGDAGPDRADFYARAHIAGQPFRSPYIHGRDHFTFGAPNGPFTFLKALPTGAGYDEPLGELLVDVRTANDDRAGTDDDIFLRVSDRKAYLLDKARHDDFERGDVETYSLPVDGLGTSPRLRDLRFLEIEKRGAGRHGEWKLASVTIRANGRVIARADAANRWFPAQRTTRYRLGGFTPADAPGPGVPIRLALFDGDAGPYGGDDHADVNPLHDRRNIAFAWRPTTSLLRGRTLGGDRYGGPLDRDGDRAEIAYAVDLLVPRVSAPGIPAPGSPAPPVPEPPGTPVPAPQEPPAGVPVRRPDLVVSELTHHRVVVRNVGDAAAATFVLAVDGRGTFTIAGLAPGGSAIREFACKSGAFTATADAAGTVDEHDETNNVRPVNAVC